MPNLPTNIVDFGGLDSSIILIQRGGISRHREFLGNFESSNVSRDNVSKEIGRNVPRTRSEQVQDRSTRS